MPTPTRYLKHKEYYRKQNAAYRAKYPWYDCWKNARCRCENPRNKNFAHYSAKGIKFLLTKAEVIALWERDSAYLLEKPSLDRINTNGNYEFSNCRFIEFVDNAARAHDREQTPETEEAWVE